MLSFNHLGNLGRLGNQMFQYASLRGIAKNNGHDFCLPPRQVFGNIDLAVRKSDCCIYDCFDLTNVKTAITQYNRVSESSFAFDQNLYEKCDDNVDLFGYFQSEKYFKSIENEIREDFKFKEDIQDVSEKIFKELFGSEKVISLHIRRGDYGINPNHPLQSLDYYHEALKHFDDNLPVVIFSDDPEWCDEQEPFGPDRFFISEGKDSRADLCLMSMCSYHIIANSSYSWWGAWLAKSEKVIAPKKWFGGDCINHNTNDLYCSDWIIL